MKIAFLGIGLMGKPMTKRLLAAGFELTLWNRTLSKAQAFSNHARVASQVEEAITDADVIITMLENGPVVDQVLYQSQAYQSIKPSSTVIDMSSIPPGLARHHAALLSQNGVSYLDAPVSGGTVGAEEASLSIMAGGDKAAFDLVQPIFRALGKSVTYIGKAGCGQLTKLANQAIVGITIGAVSEALLLAAAGGADPTAVREALSGGFASSRILELHGQRMIDRDFKPGARSRVQLKDMRTILDEARAENLTLPLSEQTYQSYLSMIANGHEDLDHSGLLVELEHLNNTSLSAETHQDA